MKKFLTGSAVVAATVAAALSVPASASAAQVPCGNPFSVKVFLTGGSGATLCFAGLGVNEFHKVGVHRLESGSYAGVVKVPGKPDRAFAPGAVTVFNPPVNPTFINLTRIVR
jgi:hypothetical protein